MSTFVVECTDCGSMHLGVHMSNCQRIAAAVAQMPVPQPTAYDRAQAELQARLDAALRRIEALERDIALDRAEAIKSEKRIEALELEVARLQCPRVTKADVDVLESIAAEQRQIQKTIDSVAVAYPPLSDEGT